MQKLIMNNLYAIILGLCVIFLSSLALSEETKQPTNFEKLRQGFSFDLGSFVDFSYISVHPSTGETFENPLLVQYGLTLGTRYTFRKSHTIGVFTNVGIGGFSMIWISHLSAGIDYTWGNKVDGWAIGPHLGFGSQGIVAGMQVFFKNIFFRPSVGIANWSKEGISGMLNLGYSFYFGG